MHTGPVLPAVSLAVPFASAVLAAVQLLVAVPLMRRRLVRPRLKVLLAVRNESLDAAAETIPLQVAIPLRPS